MEITENGGEEVVQELLNQIPSSLISTLRAWHKLGVINAFQVQKKNRKDHGKGYCIYAVSFFDIESKC